MAVQISGLGGFDSSGVVTQLVDVASQPLRDIDTKKALVDSASTTLSSFSSKLSTLKNAATALATSSGFSSMAASSSDTGIVPSVTGSAVASSYSVQVTQLATAQKTRSDSQASATSALGQQGDLTINVGSGDPVTISIAVTDSLSDIATKIGASGARVNASIINAGGSYRLSLQGLDSGADNAFTLGEGGTIALGLSDAGNTIESAKNAELTVDGLAVTRSTNQIADVIPGVALALTKTTSTPATVRLSTDSTALKSKINAFVSAYNDVVNSGHSAAGYGSVAATNSVLSADSSIRRSLDKISSLVVGVVPGTTGVNRSLSSVGVSLSRDGTMSFDATKLDSALAKDPDAVRRLFVTDTATGATGVMKTMSDAINSLITGEGSPVKSRIAALSSQSQRLTDSRAAKEKRVAAYEQALKKQFSDLDQAMSRYSSMSSAISGIKTVE